MIISARVVFRISFDVGWGDYRRIFLPMDASYTLFLGFHSLFHLALPLGECILIFCDGHSPLGVFWPRRACLAENTHVLGAFRVGKLGFWKPKWRDLQRKSLSGGATLLKAYPKLGTPANPQLRVGDVHLHYYSTAVA